jgi:hypothetical protein
MRSWRVADGDRKRMRIVVERGEESDGSVEGSGVATIVVGSSWETSDLAKESQSKRRGTERRGFHQIG